MKTSKFLIEKIISISVISLLIGFEANAQFTCSTYSNSNLGITLTLTPIPSNSVLGQSTTITAVFNYSSYQTYLRNVTVYPKPNKTEWSGGAFNVINDTTISVNPNVTTTYTCRFYYDLVREPNPSTSERANGCYVTKTITITKPSLNIQSGAKSIPCGDSTPQIYVASVIPGATTYNWNWPQGWSGPSTTQTNTATVIPDGQNAGSIIATVMVNGIQLTSPAYSVTIAPPPAITIGGIDLVCSVGTFFIQNTPQGYSTTWSSSNSNGLSINSSTGEVSRLNNYNGEITITGIINKGICNSSATKRIWVGEPSLTFNPVGNDPCYDNPYYEGPDLNGLTFSWSVSNPNVWFTSSINTRTASVISINPEYFNITLTISDGICSTSTTLFSYTDGYYCQCFFDPLCGGYGLFSTSPNPVNTELSIQLGDKSNAEVEFEINLIDYLGASKTKVISKKNILNMDVSTLPEGIYYLHIKYGDKIEKKRIIISR